MTSSRSQSALSQGSSSPLTPLSDDSAEDATDHRAHKSSRKPRKRPASTRVNLPPQDTQAKRVRRLSKTALITSQELHNDNDIHLFQHPPQQSACPSTSQCPRRSNPSDDKNPVFHPRSQVNFLLPTPASPPTSLTTCGPQPNTFDPKANFVPPEIIHWQGREPERPQRLARKIPPRLFAESQGSRSLPNHLRSYGPLWEPPALVYPAYRTSGEWEIENMSIQITPAIRKRIQTAEADLLYAPVMQLLSDSGWFKSKWNLAEGRENDRWGGWYEHLKQDSTVLLQSQLGDQQTEEYLPTGVQFPGPTSNVIPRESDDVIHNHLLNQWAQQNNQGSLNLYVGPLKIDQSTVDEHSTTQKKVTFERFGSCRLSRLIPQKAGFVFNSGAPVWSIDFLPATDLIKPLSFSNGNQFIPGCDFLAVATIIQDPGLLPPCEIKKQNKNTKSSVQIWSIPRIQPTNFAESMVLKQPDGDIDRSDCAPFERANDSSEPCESAFDSAKLDMLLAFPSQATVVRWCPRGGSNTYNPAGLYGKSPANVSASTCEVDSLGLLAIAFLDGAVGLYSVPHPYSVSQLDPSSRTFVSTPNAPHHVLTLNLAPVAKLMLPSTSCLALDWANHDVLAGGCLNGNIVIWHIETPLKLLTSSSTPQEPLLVRPTHFQPIHSAPIRSISWIRTPPIDQSGQPDIDGDPIFLSSTGYDGSVMMINTQDLAACKSLIHERGETTSLTFSSTLGCLNLADSDYSIKSICLKPLELGVSKKILVQLGLVWQIAASDFHSFIAYAAADGVCGLASLIRPQKYRSRATMWAPKVYQMDFNRNTSELRMLDNLMPEPRSQDGAAPSEAKGKFKANEKERKTNQMASRFEKKPDQPAQSVSPIGVYPSIVSVHCLSWSKNLTRGTLLASGMGCGLVRVDAVEGGFNNATPSHKTLTSSINFVDLINDSLHANNSGAGMEDEDEV